MKIRTNQVINAIQKLNTEIVHDVYTHLMNISDAFMVEHRMNQIEIVAEHPTYSIGVFLPGEHERVMIIRDGYGVFLPG